MARSGQRTSGKRKAARKVKSVQRYVIIPNTNAFNVNAENESVAFVRSLSTAAFDELGKGSKSFKHENGVKMKVVDAVAPNDTIAVEMTPEARASLHAKYPGVRIEPEVYATPAKLELSRMLVPPPALIRPARAGAAAAARHKVKVRVSTKSGEPLPDIEIALVTNLERGEGIGGLSTNKNGIATATLPSSVKRLDRILVLPATRYWPAMIKNVTAKKLESEISIALNAIDLGVADARRQLLDLGPHDAANGAGVRVAVVDSGCGPHGALSVMYGANVVAGANGANFADDGTGHGTHVAGVIAARPQGGFAGIAPGVELYVYRVFSGHGSGASSVDIAKAIRHATDSGCDLINLSLGADSDMPAVMREINRAQSLGTVCICAAGNEYRAAVSYPARYPNALAVSACGADGAFPDDAPQSDMITAKPPMKKKVFFASFSNVGPEIDIMSPGVGIVSTMPKNLFGVMDGTSMACPIVTGYAALQLSKSPDILNMARESARAYKIVQLILGKSRKFDFGPSYEGVGLVG